MAGKVCTRGHKCTYAHTHTSLTRLLAHLNNARRYLDICVYCFTCNEIADAVRQRLLPTEHHPHRADIHHAPDAQTLPPVRALYGSWMRLCVAALTGASSAERGRCWRRIGEACRSA
jgi:hypothetical protein